MNLKCLLLTSLSALVFAAVVGGVPLERKVSLYCGLSDRCSLTLRCGSQSTSSPGTMKGYLQLRVPAEVDTAVSRIHCWLGSSLISCRSESETVNDGSVLKQYLRVTNAAE
ncbi:hypothetical protein K438DRAFT_590993 [Mycena galopus ATCC 62051]|nr:hypothetical protein K438DRAFT_590993 [Mycena galopus ATCC 62051]